MGRRKKGQRIHGWLIVDKPSGLSSAQVVSRLRYRLNAQKAGHAGTLDPAATGLLAVAFGEATKTASFASEGLKSYQFAVRWGAATTTDDADGETLDTSEARPSEADIIAALPRFVGDILQVPPQVSAVKVDGARSYARVRAGETVDLAARPLHVARLTLIECLDRDTALLEMQCGKGGYVRSIARDLGEALGCFGHVAWLRRLSAGPFSLAQALPWEDLTQEDTDLASRLLPIEAALASLPCAEFSAEAAVKLRNGQPQPVLNLQDQPEEHLLWGRSQDRPVAIGAVSGGLFYPQRVFVFD
ncbi:MAG: tRNA pseudouridine(55) synthase TruB [Pseudomonadota bacterium]